METLKQYFERLETPAPSSPIGVLIARIVEKFPPLSFEDARTKAHGLLGKAAAARIYRMPAVRSPEQEEARKAQFAAFRKKVSWGSSERPAKGSKAVDVGAPLVG